MGAQRNNCQPGLGCGHRPRGPLRAEDLPQENGSLRREVGEFRKQAREQDRQIEELKRQIADLERQLMVAGTSL